MPLHLNIMNVFAQGEKNSHKNIKEPSEWSAVNGIPIVPLIVERFGGMSVTSLILRAYWQAYSLLYVVVFFFFLACPILFLSLIGQLHPITANQSKRLDARAVRDQTNGSRISGEREKVSTIPAILWKMPRLKCLESFKLAAYFRTYQLYYNVNDI